MKEYYILVVNETTWLFGSELGSCVLAGWYVYQ